MFAKANEQFMRPLGSFDGMNVILFVLFIIPLAVFVPCVMADIVKESSFRRQVGIDSVAKGEAVGMVGHGDGVGEAGPFQIFLRNGMDKDVR